VVGRSSYHQSLTFNASSLEIAGDPSLNPAAATMNVLRMPDMTFDFRHEKPILPYAVASSRLLCLWATAASSLESLPLQLPFHTSQRLLHFMVSVHEARHHVCSSPLNSTDVDALLQGARVI
jgi:hypothetical protein